MAAANNRTMAVALLSVALLALVCYAIIAVTLTAGLPANSHSLAVVQGSEASETRLQRAKRPDPRAKHKPFIPSHEWQVVEEDQPIPPGLHVEMDLQTGVKRAKLLEDSENHGVLTLSEKKRLKLDQVKALLDDGSRPREEADGVVYSNVQDKISSFRVNARAEKDHISELLEALIKPDLSESHRGKILESLEDYVHERDSARLFADGGGIGLMLSLIQEPSSDPSTRTQALLVLGAAAQNNEEIRADIEYLGGIKIVLEAFQRRETFKEKKASLFVLSALLRSSQTAQTLFERLTGPRILMSAIHTIATSSPKFSHIIVKAVTLLTDLVSFQTQQTAEDQLEGQEFSAIDLLRVLAPKAPESPIFQSLAEHGWCDALPFALESHHDNDSREKLLQAILLSMKGCSGFSLSSLPATVGVIQSEWIEAAGPEKDSYFESLLKLTETVRTFPL
eukprot:m.197588 g.197588  ORF g.197588 m.197588 type:complete len:451 (+) comp53766_c0_seq4:113-1465(+)